MPLVIYDPRAAATAGRRRTEAALGIDMASTMLDLAGANIPDAMQGVSLKPLVDGDEAEDWRDAFYYEHWFTAGGRIAPSEGVRSSMWKYARYIELDAIEEGAARWEELYDLQADPHETVNLADNPAYADQLQRQRDAWRQWRAEVR